MQLCGLCFRQLGDATAAELDAAMVNTASHALKVAEMWQQQHPQQTASSRSGTGAGVQQGQQLPQLMGPVHWQSVFKLLLECLLLAPTPDMASSCLPLMTLLLQQINAALQLRGSGSEEARDLAESTIFLFARAAFRDIPAAVHCCMQRTASLKQRRQLLRLWAGLLTMLMQGAGGLREQQLFLHASTRLCWACILPSVNPWGPSRILQDVTLKAGNFGAGGR
jgi:hypothetical protein